MRRVLNFHLLLLGVWLAAAASAAAAGSRIKDIAMVSGARDNQLSGFGLVTGLAGDGDKNPVETIQTMANLLQRYGMTVPASTLSAKNIAVVMVTADIPAFAKSGSRLDIVVSSMGDAKSLQGGVLIQTPCSGRTETCTRWGRGRCPSAGCRPGRTERAGPRCKRTIPPWGRSSTARWSSGKSPPPSSATAIWNWCCATRISPRPRAWPRLSMINSRTRRRRWTRRRCRCRCRPTGAGRP